MIGRDTEFNTPGDDCFEAVSGIIGTIVHDFNNLLMPFLAYPQLIKSDLPEGSSGRALLDVMEKAARDMVHIIQQLSDLSSRDGEIRQPVHVNDIVLSVISQLKSNGALPVGLSVHTELAPDIRWATGGVSQIPRAFYNIFLNAIDATGKEGKISVRTENVHMDSGVSATGLSHGEGEYVKITVTDSGPGMTDAVKYQILNPFFTTKKGESKRGAGLGLSVAYRIIKNQGGFIDFESKLGQGSSFSVYLPVANESTPTEMGISDDAKPEASGVSVEPNKYRILLVDDEKTILRLFQMILSSAIPDVAIDVAHNGEEAVKSFSEKRQCVLIMDLHMPVMDGQAAFFKIESLRKEHNWEMPAVLFCTGFAPPDSIRGVIASGSRHCLLPKPVNGDTIVEAVKSRLMK